MPATGWEAGFSFNSSRLAPGGEKWQPPLGFGAVGTVATSSWARCSLLIHSQEDDYAEQRELSCLLE